MFKSRLEHIGSMDGIFTYIWLMFPHPLNKLHSVLNNFMGSAYLLRAIKYKTSKLQFDDLLLVWVWEEQARQQSNKHN